MNRRPFASRRNPGPWRMRPAAAGPFVPPAPAVPPPPPRDLTWHYQDITLAIGANEEVTVHGAVSADRSLARVLWLEGPAGRLPWGLTAAERAQAEARLCCAAEATGAPEGETVPTYETARGRLLAVDLTHEEILELPGRAQACALEERREEIFQGRVTERCFDAPTEGYARELARTEAERLEREAVARARRAV